MRRRRGHGPGRAKLRPEVRREIGLLVRAEAGAENDVEDLAGGMPHWGLGRNLYPRPVHWEYFYDAYGQALVRLYHILGELRRELRARSGARRTRSIRVCWPCSPGHHWRSR